VVFSECPDLKEGNWEIFGQGTQPRVCRLPDMSRSPAGRPKILQ